MIDRVTGTGLLVNTRALDMLAWFQDNPGGSVSDLNRAWPNMGYMTNRHYVNEMVSAGLLARGEREGNAFPLELTPRGRRVLVMMMDLADMMVPADAGEGGDGDADCRVCNVPPTHAPGMCGNRSPEDTGEGTPARRGRRCPRCDGELAESRELPDVWSCTECGNMFDVCLMLRRGDSE